MSYLKLVLSLSLFIMLSGTVYASGHGEAPAAAEGGEGKEGEAAKGESKKDDYSESLARVAALQAKIHASEEAIHKMIEEKQHSKSPEEIGNIVREMVKEHRVLQKNSEEFDQARSYLQYRFPEKGLKEKRVYERPEVKSLEEMENAQSMESRIKKTLGKVRKQYEAPEASKKAAAEKAARGKVEEKSSKAKKKLEGPEISDPVILTK